MKKTSAILASFFAATVAFAAPTLTPNSVKYSDTSKPHATGRSGNATLDAVALIGKDGTTTLSVSSNGTIDKVQLQADGDNAANYTNLSGSSFTQTLSDLAPHQAISVQANVSGVDSRTDVVSVNEIVKLRPDLTVSSLNAPQRAMPGVPFVVSATIHELNGDVGARANCVLSADGAEIDRASGIWVDASDSVACTFTATLTAMGAHTLTVSATGVDPADWDTDNNSASTSITISEPFDSYHATASESTLYETTLVDGPGPYAHTDTTGTQWLQVYTIEGIRSVPMNRQNLKVHLTEWSDGAQISEASSDRMTIIDSSSNTSGDGATTFSCDVAIDDAGSNYSACTITNNYTQSSYLQFFITRRSTNVTYLSHNWNTQVVDANGNPVVTDTYYHTEGGQQTAHYGSSVALDLTLTDGVTTVQAAPTIALAPFRDDRGGPHTMCRNVRGGRLCINTQSFEVGNRGEVDRTSSY